MNRERAAMKGVLAEKKGKLGQLKLKAEGLCNAIRQGLSPALTAIEDMEIPQLDVMMDELALVYGEILNTMTEIEKVERELG